MDEANDPIQLDWLTAAVLATAALALAVVIWRGWLRPDALADGPRRDVGLQWWDLPAALAVMLLGGILAALVGTQLFDVDPATGRVAGGSRAEAAWVLLNQALGQGAVLVYVMWRTAGAARGWRRFGLVPTRPVRDLAAGGLGLLVAVPLVVGVLNLMTLVGQWLGVPAPRVGHGLLQQMLESDDAAGLALMIVAAVVVAPFLEELVFRGVVQTALLSVVGVRRRWPVVVVAALLFAMIHVGATTLSGQAEDGVSWHALPGLAVLGLVLGWLYEKTGSLWPAVLVHAGFNAANVAMVLEMQRQGVL